MKYKWKPLVLALAIPLAVGGLSALLTRQGMAVFRALEKPPLAPPGWLFPAVWTILFLLMGLASYLVFAAGRGTQSGRTALWFYAVQLLFNFFWSIFFFNCGAYLFAFFWLLALWVLVFITAVLFFRISRPAGWLLSFKLKKFVLQRDFAQKAAKSRCFSVQTGSFQLQKRGQHQPARRA